MPELISNPSTEPDREVADSEGHASATNSANSAHGGMVVQYHADADFSDQSEDRGDDSLGDVVETNSKPDLDTDASGNRGRPLARVLVGGLVKLCWSGVRGTVRFPRTSAAAAMLTLILGSILFTQPAKSTPKNQIPSSPPTSSLDEEKKGREKSATKPDLTSIAKDVPPSKSPNDARVADRSGQTAVPALTEELLPPLPRVGADAGATDSLTKPQQAEKAVAPPSQSIDPAPLPTIGQGDANLLSQSPHTPSPTPLPSPASSATQPEPAPAPTQITETSKVPGPAELPRVPSSLANDLNLPAQESLGSFQSSTTDRSAERVPPPADAELESTSAAIDGDRPTKLEGAGHLSRKLRLQLMSNPNLRRRLNLRRRALLLHLRRLRPSPRHRSPRHRSRRLRHLRRASEGRGTEAGTYD